jgi:hypothetical protein
VKFDKIKVTDEGVFLDWKRVGDGEEEDVKWHADEAPVETFTAAMQAFRPYIADLLGLSTAWAEELRITTLSLSVDSENRRGLIVTAVKPIAKASGRPLVLNTPLMKERHENSSPEASGIFEPETMVLIAKAEMEAFKYRKGERAQLDAFDDKNRVDPEKAAEPSDDVSKARKKRKDKVDPKAGTPNEVMNPDSKPNDVDLSDNDGLRALLLRAGRDVPVDAINQWSALEFSRAREWATLVTTTHAKEEAPLCVQKDGTPSLFDDFIAAGGNESHLSDVDQMGAGGVTLEARETDVAATSEGSDTWTQSDAPPKVDDAQAAEIRAAADAGATKAPAE